MAGVFPAIDIFEQISQMLRRIVSILIVVPLAIVIVAFAVANRQSVTVSFDPFSSASPAYAATVPLFVLIFALLILGVLVGGVAAWIRQGRSGDGRHAGSMGRSAHCIRRWTQSAAVLPPNHRRPRRRPLLTRLFRHQFLNSAARFRFAANWRRR